MALLTRDVEPLWIARYDYQAGWRLPPHSHRDYFQIILIVSGTGEALIGDTRCTLRDSQLLFLRPGLRHGLETAANSTVRTLDTKFKIRRPELRRACLKLEAVRPQTDRWVTTLLEAMHAEAREHGAHTTEICQSLLVQVLLLLLKHETAGAAAEIALADERGDEDGLCGRMHRFLRENCAREITQRVLSEAMHYSYRHLHAIWRNRHGGSPLQALWRYRIERAMQLIRYSDYELKRIAELTGFVTVHHFTRVFTKIAGTPPARWRERERRSVWRDITLRTGFKHPILTIQSTHVGEAWKQSPQRNQSPER